MQRKPVMSAKNTGNWKGKAPDSAARMNFLYQAAHTILNNQDKKNSKSEKDSQTVAAYYTQLMIGIGHKAVLRSSKELKRTICKGCRGLLLPGKTAKPIFNKKNRQIGSVCSICKTEKIFPLNHVSKKAKAKKLEKQN